MSDFEQIKKTIRLLAKSITADDASPTFDANGGYVSCLTESMLSVANVEIEPPRSGRVRPVATGEKR